MPAERFEFLFDPRYRAPARLFRIGPDSAWVEVSDDRFRARFGPWRVSTPLTNVKRATITGPYAFWKTAGPARLAITDRGLTFATNGQRGVEISFVRPVRGLDPLGVLRHPELTVTVRDPERLLSRLSQRDS
jgi:hypothetical protein